MTKTLPCVYKTPMEFYVTLQKQYGGLQKLPNIPITARVYQSRADIGHDSAGII